MSSQEERKGTVCAFATLGARTFDGNNTVRLERHENGSPCTHVEFMLDNDMSVSGSVTQSLLSAIAG